MSTDTLTEVKPLTPTIVAKSDELPTVRSWAIANGFTVGKRGRFHRDILEGYAKAHGLAAPPAPKTAAVVAGPSPIRAWALANGYQVPARGRFSLDLVNAYNAAHGLDAVVSKKVTKPAKTRKAASAPVVPVAAPEPTDSREAVLVKVGGKGGGLYSCGFCQSDNHERCIDVAVNGAAVKNNVQCACSASEHSL